MSDQTPGPASERRPGQDRVHGSPEGRPAAGAARGFREEADVLGSVRRQMTEWRHVSEALRRELEREELDLTGIERLLERREAAYRHLAKAVGQMGAHAPALLQRDAELRQVAAELLACDRLVMEQARARQQEATRRLEELRRLRQGAAGYRRAAGRALAAEPTFFDRCI